MSLRLKELYKNKNNGNKEIADFPLKRTWSVDISKLTVKSRKIPNKNNTNKQTNVWMLYVVVLFQWSVFLLCRNFDSKKGKKNFYQPLKNESTWIMPNPKHRTDPYKAYSYIFEIRSHEPHNSF